MCAQPIDDVLQRCGRTPAARRFRDVQAAGEDRCHCKTAQLARGVIREVVADALWAHTKPMSSLGGFATSEEAKVAPVEHPANGHLRTLQQEGRLAHGQKRAKGLGTLRCRSRHFVPGVTLASSRSTHQNAEPAHPVASPWNEAAPCSARELWPVRAYGSGPQNQSENGCLAVKRTEASASRSKTASSSSVGKAPVAAERQAIPGSPSSKAARPIGWQSVCRTGRPFR